MTTEAAQNYLDLNRANWNDRAEIHFSDTNDWYGIQDFLGGGEARCQIDVDGLGDLTGKKVLHSQCHFGLDSLSAARQAAHVTGLDFSSNAIARARQLAEQSGLADKTRFVEANVYDAATLLPAESFDVIYASWGVTGWLPDLAQWAQVLCGLLKPGGFFFYADGHPFAYCWDEDAQNPHGPFRPSLPYWIDQPIVEDETHTYNDSAAAIENTKTVEFAHTLEDYFKAFLRQDMALENFQEHDAIPWRMFKKMERSTEDRQYRLPADTPSLPLGFSMKWRK